MGQDGGEQTKWAATGTGGNWARSSGCYQVLRHPGHYYQDISKARLSQSMSFLGNNCERGLRLLSIWKNSRAWAHQTQKITETGVRERNALQKANPHRRELVLQRAVLRCMCVRQRGEKQAVTLSTTLESLFSTRPLYLVSNISPGKRKHFSGQSLGNILSSSL